MLAQHVEDTAQEKSLRWRKIRARSRRMVRNVGESKPDAVGVLDGVGAQGSDAPAVHDAATYRRWTVMRKASQDCQPS